MFNITPPIGDWGVPLFEFMFGRLNETQLQDIQDTIYLLLILVGFDVVSRFGAEAIRYNRLVGRPRTLINNITALWHALWPVYIEGKKKPIRLLFSEGLRKGLVSKSQIYPALIALSIWVVRLPDSWVLFGMQVDATISILIMIAPIFMELYSITENLLEIDRHLLLKLYKSIIFIRDFLKG